MTTYTPLFTLILQHGYFIQGVPAAFSIVPLPSTQKALDAGGMIFRQTNDGATVLYNAAVFPSNTESLAFALVFKDPAFVNYTDLPLFKGAEMFYVSNYKKTSGALSQSKSVGAADVYTISGAALSVTPASKTTKPVLNTVTGVTVNVTTQSDSLVTYSNLRGAYVLKNDTEQTKMYANTELSGKSPFMVFEIFLSELKPTKSPAYTLNWNARSTSWIYSIISTGNRSLEKLSIASNERNLTFSKQKATTEVGAYPAQQFLSNRALLLQELPAFKFALNEQQNNKESLCLMDALPLPGINNITMNRDGFVSTIYVYI